ncbi:MAG TPA: C39 family peptidase [Thiobacillaceae bacterium]|nr:C39 family peptidase [Thiobacillaceae bacterium]
MLPVKLHLPVRMLPQPDETTCGPTCLHAVYRYWGADEPLTEVIARTRKLEQGGTFAVFLACDALRRGFEATIYTYNLTVFDPTWFRPGVDIAERLGLQRQAKSERRLGHATEGYLEFLALGGRLRFTDLSRTLIRGLLRRGLPILTGLSSTFLYRTAREYGPDDHPDDVRGTPGGHFVVMAGYDRKARGVLVADPYGPHPYGPSHEYWIKIDRVIGAVLLGIVTHDANLLVIHPPRGGTGSERHEHPHRRQQPA